MKLALSLIPPVLVMLGLYVPSIADFIILLIGSIQVITILILVLGIGGIIWMKSHPVIQKSIHNLYERANKLNSNTLIYQVLFLSAYGYLLYLFSPILLNLVLITVILAKLFNMIALKEFDLPLAKVLI